MSSLKDGEPHPSAYDAREYLLFRSKDLLLHVEANCALEDNMTSEICGETARRLLAHEPVSDRYLLGLAWPILFEEVLRLRKQVGEHAEFAFKAGEITARHLTEIEELKQLYVDKKK